MLAKNRRLIDPIANLLFTSIDRRIVESLTVCEQRTCFFTLRRVDVNRESDKLYFNLVIGRVNGPT